VDVLEKYIYIYDILVLDNNQNSVHFDTRVIEDILFSGFQLFAKNIVNMSICESNERHVQYS
jgi:hypothetical protein